MLSNYKKVGKTRDHDIYEYEDGKKRYYGAIQRGVDDPEVPLNMPKHGMSPKRERAENSAIYHEFLSDKRRDRI